MTSTEWTVVREIFDAAIDLDAAGRERLLDQRCGDDSALRARVAALLDADAATSTAAVAIEGDAPISLAEAGGRDTLVGTKIGRYAIRGVLGQGGMSTVFEALQEQPRRTVAVKTMRFGLLSATARRRFEYESEVLGQLRHPAIAQVYEAGTWREPLSGEELPFFAMEFVAGARALDRYVREERLDLHSTLELFLLVCDAVQHGHQLGFMHRDLKPQNLLVDESGRPKVIDFGIARATEVDPQSRSTRTQAGSVLGTLQYMAPEQLDGLPETIDTRVDVYALGVILYELLAGRPPFEFGDRSLAALARHVRNHQPPRPSLLGGGAGDFSLASEDRDLDWITAKAMAADQVDRYRSVSELAADLRRFLDHEAVSVGPPSRTYHFRKFVRRNRALVGGAVAVLIALCLAVIGTTWQMLRAETAREAAEAERLTATEQTARAQRISDFLSEILRLGDPADGRYRSRPDMTIREALDLAAARVDELSEEPEVEAGVRFQLGNAYRSYRDFDESERHLRRAVELREQLHDRAHADLAAAINSLALTLSLAKENEEALTLHRRALVMYREVHGEKHSKVAMVRLNVGGTLGDLKRLDEAESELRAAIAMFRDLGPSEYTFLAVALGRLGEVERKRGDRDAAIGRFREALDVYERDDTLWHPFAGYAWEMLAVLHDERGEKDERIPALRSALAVYERSYGPESDQTGRVQFRLGRWLLGADQPVEAAELLGGASAVAVAFYGAESAEAAAVGKLLADARPAAEARLLGELEQTDAAADIDRPSTLRALVGLYESWERPDRAAEFRALLAAETDRDRR